MNLTSLRFSFPNLMFFCLCVAVVETLGWSGKKFVSRKQPAESKLAHITSDKDLQFVDLTGNGLARLGADAELYVGRDRGLCQRWSRSFWQHPAKPTGIYYISRHDPGGVCYALFENFDTNILSVEDWGFLNERRVLTLLAEIFDHYKFCLVN